MANPFKILAPLSASAGAIISGSDGLKVKQGGLTVEDQGLIVTGTIQASEGITLSGTLEFTQDSQIISVPLSSGDGGAASTLKIIPDKDLTNSDQYLVVDPTSPSHIHLRAGGTIDASNAYLFLGGEKANVQVTDGTDHNVKIHSSGSSAYEWVFGNDGVLAVNGTALALSTDLTNFATRGEVTGAINTFSSEVTSSFVSKDGNGNVTINGNLTVSGTQTTVNVESTTVNFGDTNLQIATGSTTLAELEGAGFSFGSGSLVNLTYADGTGMKLDTGLDVSSSLPISLLSLGLDEGNWSEIKANTNGVTIGSRGPGGGYPYVSLYTQYEGENANSFFGLGYKTAVLYGDKYVSIGEFQGSGSDTDATNAVISIAAVNNASSHYETIDTSYLIGDSRDLPEPQNAAAKTVNIGIDGYTILNLAGTTTLSGTLNISSSVGGIIEDVAQLLNTISGTVAGGTIVHADRYTSLRKVMTYIVTTPANDTVFDLTGSNEIYGLSGSSASDLADKLANASFDLAVRGPSNNTWYNDLVSLTVTSVQSGSAYYPQATISAPAIDTSSTIRLIVVNETSGAIE